MTDQASTTQAQPAAHDFGTMLAEALKRTPKNAEGREFRRDGLPHHWMVAEKARKKFRTTRDVREMAKYADVVHVTFTDYMASTTPATVAPHEKRDLNATALANIAYVSLHATSEEHRTAFGKLLETIY